MNRLLIVSNRLPITIQKKKEKLYFKQSLGGLATGLGSFYESFNSKWIGWCGITSEKISFEEKKNIEAKLEKDFLNYSVFLSKRQKDLYYSEFCNTTLWPRALYTEHLVPIYEEYDKRNLPEKKAFRILPRKFVAKILKFESNSMIPEDNFTETEKQVLNVFANKKYFKSAKVAGKTFYFGLNSEIRKYVIIVLGR
jgi:trehalose-6-phosphate synthase